MYPYWRDMRSRNRSLRRMSPVGLGFPLNRVQASTPTFVPSHPTPEFASLSYQHHQPQQQQPPVPLGRALTACSSTEPETISSSRQMRRLRIRGADSKRQPRSRPAQAASPRVTCDDVQGRSVCQQPAKHSAPATRNPARPASPRRTRQHLRAPCTGVPPRRRRAAAGRPGLLAAAADRKSVV